MPKLSFAAFYTHGMRQVPFGLVLVVIVVMTLGQRPLRFVSPDPLSRLQSLVVTRCRVKGRDGNMRLQLAPLAMSPVLSILLELQMLQIMWTFALPAKCLRALGATQLD